MGGHGRNAVVVAAAGLVVAAGCNLGAPPIETGEPAVDAAAGDVDGDGDVDLVTTADGGWAVLANDGDAGFAATRHPFGTFGRGDRVDLVDLEGDGDLDVVQAVLDFNVVEYRVEVHVNDGAGGFTGGPLGRTWSSAQDTELGDVTGDGNVDLRGPVRPRERARRRLPGRRARRLRRHVDQHRHRPGHGVPRAGRRRRRRRPRPGEHPHHLRRRRRAGRHPAAGPQRRVGPLRRLVGHRGRPRPRRRRRPHRRRRRRPRRRRRAVVGAGHRRPSRATSPSSTATAPAASGRRSGGRGPRVGPSTSTTSTWPTSTATAPTTSWPTPRRAPWSCTATCRASRSASSAPRADQRRRLRRRRQGRRGRGVDDLPQPARRPLTLRSLGPLRGGRQPAPRPPPAPARRRPRSR